MSDKKPESLADNLSSPRKYVPSDHSQNPAHQTQIDFNKLKTKLDSFKKKVLKKFPFTKSLGILPPQSFQLFEEDEAELEMAA